MCSSDLHRDAHAPGSQRQKISFQEETDGVKQSPIQKGRKMTSGKSFVSIVMERDISLAFVPRNGNDPINNANGNRALALVAIAKPK